MKSKSSNSGFSRNADLVQEIEAAITVREYGAYGKVTPWSKYLPAFPNFFSILNIRYKHQWEYFVAFRIYLGSLILIALDDGKIFSKPVSKRTIEISIEKFQHQFNDRPEWKAFLDTDSYYFPKENLTEGIVTLTHYQRELVKDIANRIHGSEEKKENMTFDLYQKLPGRRFLDDFVQTVVGRTTTARKITRAVDDSQKLKYIAIAPLDLDALDTRDEKKRKAKYAI